MNNPTGKHQYPYQTNIRDKSSDDFKLVKKQIHFGIYTWGQLVEKKLYECWNNLTGECRMIQGCEAINWFKEVAGSLDIGHVRARFTIIPIHEDSRN
jgi:hypothetical protein